MSVMSRMANQLTLIIFILVLTIITKAVPICNETLQYNIATNGDKQNAVPIKSGSLVNSNVFVFKISQKPENKITLILDKPFNITGIGIRQRFNMTEVENQCTSSLHQDPWASYNITYTDSESDEPKTLDYPPGVCMGIINPNTMLPYQEIATNKLNKKTLKVAVISTIMRTITIEKKIVQEQNEIYNAGTFCLQFELYGCQSATKPFDLNTIVLEYQMYQPISLPGSTMSSDSTYTGKCSEGTCTGGTGKLTDKQIDLTLYNIPDMFVLWELSAPNIILGDRNLSLLKMLLILDSVYFIEVVKIYGTLRIGNSDISAPSFVTINGITVDTSDRVVFGDIYIINLFPFMKTNTIQFQFYVDAEYNVTQLIAFSEISIEVGNSDIHCQEPQASELVRFIVVVIIALIFLALFITSLVINLYFVIQYFNQKKNVKTHYATHQISENNNYTRTISTDYQMERLDTNYESIQFDESVVNKENYNKTLEYNTIPAQIDRTNSVIVMPTNPTYVSTLPLSPIEEVSGYSHLVHSQGKEGKFIESNTLPRMKEKSSSPGTAAERRKSYCEQHDLSDLK